MTCCVGTLCDRGKSIVLISDKMIGTGMIESEPEINKVMFLHKNWRVMLAGNDISLAFPIVDAAKLALSRVQFPTLKNVADEVYKAYADERGKQSEAIYLAPRGWTSRNFNSSKAAILPESTREELGVKIAGWKVEVAFLVAGFDDKGRGHIFSVDDYEHRGKPRVQDLPGYHAIGSGAPGAMYMMAYREVSSVMPLRLALYYAIEGKCFGERAGGVGTKTDALILREGMPPFRVTTQVLEEKLFDLCLKLEPRDLRKKHVDILNSLSGSRFSTVPELTISKKDDEWVIESAKASASRRSTAKKSGSKS